MTTRVLIDTGPLFAIVSEDDRYHKACLEQFHLLTPPLLTCWPVLTEAIYLLRHQRHVLERLLKGFEVDLFRLLILEPEALPWIAAFFRRYPKLEPQLADACLVYLSEREDIDTVFTLDRRDFSIYRRTGKRGFHLLP